MDARVLKFFFHILAVILNHTAILFFSCVAEHKYVYCIFSISLSVNYKLSQLNLHTICIDLVSHLIMNSVIMIETHKERKEKEAKRV